MSIYEQYSSNTPPSQCVTPPPQPHGLVGWVGALGGGAREEYHGYMISSGFPAVTLVQAKGKHIMGHYHVFFGNKLNSHFCKNCVWSVQQKSHTWDLLSNYFEKYLQIPHSPNPRAPRPVGLVGIQYFRVLFENMCEKQLYFNYKITTRKSYQTTWVVRMYYFQITDI
jgi:hypothetical protein